MKELTETRRQILKTIDIKNEKIQRLRNELHQARNRALYGETGADLIHKLSLYSLLCQYHLSIFKDYVLNSEITEEERNEVEFDPERLSTYTVDDINLSAMREFLLLLPLKENLLKADEQELIDYSLKNRYLSQDVVQFVKADNPISKEAIGEAIDILLRNDEKDYFQRMFKKVFNSSAASKSGAETTSGN